MSLHEYLMRAYEEDAQRAGELDRELLEARRSRLASLPCTVPAAAPRRLAQLEVPAHCHVERRGNRTRIKRVPSDRCPAARRGPSRGQSG